ncbi:hypothetical protein SAMN05519104_4325 [Rhizobiales bacterium GAS188]|nr:hypothetical protein SAMN05519104_4325 [Rhizobiales bacterium GAS188]
MTSARRMKRLGKPVVLPPAYSARTIKAVHLINAIEDGDRTASLRAFTLILEALARKCTGAATATRSSSKRYRQGVVMRLAVEHWAMHPGHRGKPHMTAGRIEDRVAKTLGMSLSTDTIAAYIKNDYPNFAA